MKARLLRTAWRLALREMRGGLGDLRIFMLCLFLAVTVISTLNLISHSIRYALEENAKELAGGDVELLLTNFSATPEQQAFLEQYGNFSQVIETRAMAQTGDGEDYRATLVELKGVDNAYPLVGSVTLKPAIPLSQALTPGNIVAEPTLLDQMQLEIGDTLRISGGEYTIAAVITREPDRVVSAFSFGPRVLISNQALQKSGLIQPGSLARFRHRVLLTTPQAMNAFTEDVERTYPNMPWRITPYTRNNERIEETLSRLELFLNLAALSTLIIGGIGIASATGRYIQRKLRVIATLKSIGATSDTLLATYLIVLGIVSIITILISLAVSYGLAVLTMPYLMSLVSLADTVKLSLSPLLLAAWFGLITVLSFSLPPLGKGLAVRPAMLLRGFISPSKERANSVVVFATFVCGTLWITTILFATPNAVIALGFLTVVAFSIVVFWVTSRILRSLTRRIHTHHPHLRQALAHIQRPGSSLTATMLAIGIGLSVLVTLTLTEQNIRQQILTTIPDKAPSLFMIDIQNFQAGAFFDLLGASEGVSKIESTPMLRGRIVKVNGVPVSKIEVSPDVSWAVRGDRGLTFRYSIPENNELTEGTWWNANYSGPPLVSMDGRVARGLGLKIGETITVNVLGQNMTAIIQSFRKVDYSSLQINFAMIFTPNSFTNQAYSYIATARVDTPQRETQLIRTITQQFPNISTIRISETLKLVNEMVLHIAMAIRVVVLVALFSGVLVLVSAINATLQARIYETVVMKVLGATRKDIATAFLLEWLIVGITTGILSGSIGILGSALVLDLFRAFNFSLQWATLIQTVALALLVVVTLGFTGNLRAFAAKTAPILRNE